MTHISQRLLFTPLALCTPPWTGKLPYRTSVTLARIDACRIALAPLRLASTWLLCQEPGEAAGHTVMHELYAASHVSSQPPEDRAAAAPAAKTVAISRVTGRMAVIDRLLLCVCVCVCVVRVPARRTSGHGRR
ncbi:hypothetical protein B0J12DRAFT_364872 [Macrophomina phaseolina]|uniref:Secreted protein n=1 Tax=Macrophomina phaseolina TaxID=35725 RepID=A0ABQ8FTM3_9PEZI|nr:hypothetical protein B0J12DRAFT_364872 [Macrophomina phaseolina]